MIFYSMWRKNQCGEIFVENSIKSFPNVFNRTLQEKISLIMEQMKMEYEKPWNVKVVRRRFKTTSIEQ